MILFYSSDVLFPLWNMVDLSSHVQLTFDMLSLWALVRGQRARGAGLRIFTCSV